MGRLLRHEACPKCREQGRDRHGDNLGVYDDGSEYCYSCGYRTLPSGRLLINSLSPRRRLSTEYVNSISLPDDVEPSYPVKCVNWINQYELTTNDLYANKCLWSEKQQRLIFPFYNDGSRELLAWQGRYFGPDNKKPKWLSYGKLDTLFHIFNRNRSRDYLILVEDIVSAYKLGRVGHPVMPLFGSYISDSKLCNLKLLTDSLWLFLDPDKYGAAVTFCNRSMALGLPCRVIHADKDPKEISYEQLTSLLN